MLEDKFEETVFQKYSHDPLLNKNNLTITHGMSAHTRRIVIGDLDYKFPNQELLDILLKEID